MGRENWDQESGPEGWDRGCVGSLPEVWPENWDRKVETRELGKLGPGVGIGDLGPGVGTEGVTGARRR